MLTWLTNLFRSAPHLKASTLTGQLSYYAYHQQGWQAISKSRFDWLLGSDHYYLHQAASSAHELIYNRRSAKPSPKNIKRPLASDDE